VSSDPGRAAVSWQKAEAHLREASAQDADASPMAVIHSSDYAMFHAARAVLFHAVGRAPEQHDGVIQQFGLLVRDRDDALRAAGKAFNEPKDERNAADYDETLDANLRGYFSVAGAAARRMKPRRAGRIVLVSSTAGQRGEPGHSHYAASKGALQSMMMSIAVELAPRVRVNLVSPGWVRTPMAEESLRRIGPALVATIPNRRVAEVEDVVNAALYLASDASGHLIGQDLCVSGGALLVVPRGQVKPV